MFVVMAIGSWNGETGHGKMNIGSCLLMNINFNWEPRGAKSTLFFRLQFIHSNFSQFGLSIKESDNRSILE